MRKLATTALTALTLSLMGSAAALADHNDANQGPGYNQQYNGPYNPQPGQGQWNQGPRGGQWNDGRQGGYQDEYFDDNDRRYDGDRSDRRHDRRFDDRRFNFQLHFGNFDRWERGWGYGNYHNQYRSHQPLSHWQIVRRLERQGYYGVRHLQRARGGFGYRAFAFTHRGQPVMLRVNPFTGRVMAARYV